ncbi:MAG: serine/threonine-protein kinase [Myxococcota bacterium]
MRCAVRARLLGAEPTPMRLGRYVVLDWIGSGGTSVVYRGLDEALDRQVAIKLLATDPATDGALRVRFEREGRALARLRHPGTVRVYDVGRQDDLVFMVVELVEGATLADWMDRSHDWRSVLDVLLPVGDALAAAHAAGLVHRDVKPANVLLDDSGSARLVDFGFVREMEDSNKSGPRLRIDPHLTGVLGTPAYMAPEQWAGGACDARTDQFAFCVTLYEALFGLRPYEGDSRGAFRETPDADVPAWLPPILERGLALSASARFPSLAELLAAIRGRLASVRESDAVQAAFARLRREDDLGARRELGLVARRTLERALEAWAENPDALETRPLLNRQLFEDALARGDLSEAERWLDELPAGARTAAGARLQEERDARDAPRRRLAELEHERDTRVEERFKATSIAGSAVVWTLAYVAYALCDRFALFEVTPTTLLPFYGFFSIGAWLGVWSLPAKYASNRVNRDLTIVSGLVATAHVVMTLACTTLGGSLSLVLAIAHVQAALGYGIAGLAYDRRAAYLTPPNLVGAAAIAYWPGWALEVSAFVVPVGSFAWAWSHWRGAKAPAP